MANVAANALTDPLLFVVVFVNLRRNVVHILQDLLDNGLLTCPDGTFHVRKLHTGISIDFCCNSFTAAHVLFISKGKGNGKCNCQLIAHQLLLLCVWTNLGLELFEGAFTLLTELLNLLSSLILGLLQSPCLACNSSKDFSSYQYLLEHTH